jgi:hypothetical protein
VLPAAAVAKRSAAAGGPECTAALADTAVIAGSG